MVPISSRLIVPRPAAKSCTSFRPFRRTAIPILTVALALLALAALPSCNTLEGVGKDLSDAGKGLQQLGTGTATVGDKDPNPYSR